MCYTTFAYDKNTNKKIYECFGCNKKVATEMFYKRTKGLNVVGFGYMLGSDLHPMDGLEILPRVAA